MSSEKNILILGAGYAGIHAAKKLAKNYKKRDDVKITLIDKNPFHTLMTELHEVAGGRVHPESVQIDLGKIFNKTKVNLVTDFITSIDKDKKVVKTKNGSYNYDYLIIGTGSEPAFFGVPGVKENGFTLWSMEDALEIRAHIKETFEKAAKERDENLRREMLTFVVAGSGFTGIEMAGELLEWKSKLAKEYKVDESEVKLMVVEAMGTILNMLDRKQADKAERYMKKHGMKILKNSPITEVKEDSITLKSGEVIPTRTLIWTCGIQAVNEAKEYGMEAGRAGRLKTNEYMEAINEEGIYVVGDLTYFEETEGRATPQIVEAAEQTAVCAAKNIIASIDGSEKHKFKSNYHGFMVSIGGRYAVAHVGGMKMSGFFAMLTKHMVNLYYLVGVAGFYQVWQYLLHEFFHMEDRRSIMGDHLSSRGNRLWSVPLRIFFGLSWIYEATAKVFGEETFKTGVKSIKAFKEMLKNGFGEDSWLTSDTVRMPFEWLHDAATSGASEAAEGATETVTPILERSPKFFEAIMKVFLPTPEMALFAQRMILFVELAIGLALIVGLFTWLASAASAFLVVNFILSAMFGWGQLWFFFVAIALMNGSSRTFGLDYYVMPWIRDKIYRAWFGKEKAVYNDNK